MSQSGGQGEILSRRGTPIHSIIVLCCFCFTSLWCGLQVGTCAVAQQPQCEGPADLEKAIATAPSVDAYNALGAYFAKRGEMSCAMMSFEKALRLNPRSWETRYNLALALMESGHWEQANRELKQLVLEKPAAVNSHNALATTFLELGQPDAAVEEFKKVLAVDPRSVHALYNLGRALMAQRRFAAAVSYLKQAVAL